MLEELLANLNSPALLGAIGAAAVIAFVIGRLSNMGAKKREESLKRDVLDAKASVPQLESSVRNRDTQIGRLQEEISGLNDRTNELLRDQDKQSNALRSAEREVKNLNSELNAVRGVRSADDNLVMDGFDDEVTTEPGDSATATQLKKTEALYEKLKGALIKRDERIEELELLLSGEREADSQPVEREEIGSDESRALEAKLGSQTETINGLTDQISELRKEKEMLEDLANRRSKSNRALKDASAESEAKVPALEQEIVTRDETIQAREASIKRLLSDVETTKSDLSERESRIQALDQELTASAQTLEESTARQKELEGVVNRREERITSLETELTSTLDRVQSLQNDVQTADQKLSEQQSAIDNINAQLSERDRAEEALKNTIRDRDFRIDTLDAEKTDLQSALGNAENEKTSAERSMNEVRQEAADQQQLTNKRQQAMDAERDVAERESAALKREIEDLNASITQHQNWMEKLKASLEDREERAKAQQQRMDELTGEVDAVNEQLKKRHDERQAADDARHELEREIVTLKSRSDTAQSEASEQAQTVSVYKSMLADKDFRIEALEQELATLKSVSGNDADSTTASEAVDSASEQATDDPGADSQTSESGPSADSQTAHYAT